jgi:hypothetical protein
MPVIYYARTFGGIPMLIADISTDRGRDVAIQSPAIGDRHTVRDRGRKQISTRVSIIFCDQPGLAPYTDRSDEFIALAESGEAQILSHPFHGSSRVLAGELEVVGESSAREIRASCVFHEVDPPTNVLPVAGGTNPAAGVESVAVAAAAASTALVEIGIPGDIDEEDERADGIVHADLAAVADTIATWRDAGDELDSQQVFLEVVEATAAVDAFAAELELAQDITRWQAYRDVMLLRYEIVRAGEAFTAAARSTFDVFVDAPRPVLAICAEIYGAAAARGRAIEIAKNNRLRTPGLVPAGTTLKMPAVGR